ncbi:uncharacterized protein ACA1_055380 [Acanthamoeba castellanii str. Neff]|uniref:PB1 domain-containing protein n=1 Tax=Acanthamoeba castellanii (strain ATCC 30010 / Neff) TaxID=1257118 RepID=L8H6B1_ACACF|nr:uncharacterized protein ACA1_055380 [Acanthamoeba castellanii str. Neff]ELR20772.1 hypothetical protein ACA1_055380 [Acanthamoeba castellanii str. Neff]
MQHFEEKSRAKKKQEQEQELAADSQRLDLVRRVLYLSDEEVKRSLDGLQEHRHTESEMVGRSRSPTLGRLRKQGQVATLMQQEMVQDRSLVHFIPPPRYTDLVELMRTSPLRIPSTALIQFRDSDGDLLPLRHQDDLNYFLDNHKRSHQPTAISGLSLFVHL